MFSVGFHVSFFMRTYFGHICSSQIGKHPFRLPTASSLRKKIKINKMGDLRYLSAE
jgi:hypothetical protein